MELEEGAEAVGTRQRGRESAEDTRRREKGGGGARRS